MLVDNYDSEYDENKKVKCHWCKWEGTMKQTKYREVNSDLQSWQMLAGRRGYEYDCPKCGFTVAHHYTMMS